MEKITVDFILAGQAVPEEIKRDRRIYQCTAGFSPTLNEMIRIYPIPHQLKLKRWTIYEIDLERNPKDNRSESWKIQGSRTHWKAAIDRVRVKGKLSRDEWISFIQQHAEEICIRDLNEAKRSLAIIKPEILHAYISEQEVSAESQHKQKTLTGVFTPKTGKSSPHFAKVKYRCPGCKSQKPHDQRILEYGVYMGIENNPDNKEKVIDNLRLFDDDYEKYFFIGNINKFRNSWIIISVLRWKR